MQLTDPTSHNVEDLSGTNIKGYELLERIGAGGFGAVYRARQTTIDREVAIKIILPGWANNPEFIRRFEVEAQLIARLEHPYITPLHDYWRDPSGAYLVMRYLRGGSIRFVLQNDAYDLESASRVLDQVASALDLAHRNGVIHRDIKPGNILLDEDGNSYLADFGIAKDLTAPPDAQTAPDAVLGSLDYISPEQARSEPVSSRTDIYSLGVTLYEMITGDHPFKGSSSVEKLYHHINDPLPLLTDLADNLDDDINTVIQTATAKDPLKRYADVLAFAIAFRESIGREDADRELQAIEQLTLREHEVLQLIVQGLTNREIADKLFVTVATVRWHIRQLYKKLGVRSRVQAIVRARELDLIHTNAVGVSEKPTMSASTAISLPEPENPYKGLRSFQMSDAADFFGRETLVEKLLERLADAHRYNRFLAVVGPSGSGKSSLVRAGLIPALWQGKLPGSEKWFVVDMIPGMRPLDQLEVALVRVAANQAANLRAQLARDEHGLLRVADIILPRDDTELVLVIDQFEEVFTLAANDEACTQFLALLHAAVIDPRSRVRVVVTLRADYYDRPLHYSDFGELMRSRMETVLPLSAQGLEKAITGPAQRVSVTLEDGMVAQIVSEMNYQAGALPLLQYALTELFDRRQGRVLTHDAYRAIGGAVGALAHQADEILYSLDDTGQALARQMFLRLVTLGEQSEDTRRRVPRSELLALTSDIDLMDEIIDAFADERLLTLDHDPATRRPTVEVAHEAILSEWTQLHDWLNDSRHDIQQQRLLAAATDEWLNADRDASYLLRDARLDQFAAWAEQTDVALTINERTFIDTSVAEQQRRQDSEHERQQRELETQRQLAEQQRRAANRLRYLAAGLGVFLIAALGLALFAFDERDKAQDAHDVAQEERDRAQNLALVNGARLALTDGDLETALALALAANQSEPASPQAQLVLSEVAYRPGPLRVFEGHEEDSSISTLEFSPDGKQALSVCVNSKIVRLWDVTTGKIIHTFEHPGGAWDAAFSPDGKTILTAGSGPVLLWDLETKQIIHRLEGHPYTVYYTAFSPDGTMALTAGGWYDRSEYNTILWDLETGDIIRTFDGHEGGVGSVYFSPDGTRFLSGGVLDFKVFEWDVATGELLRTIGTEEESHTGAVVDTVYSPDGTQALTLSWDETMRLWDLETNSLIRSFDISPGNGSYDLMFSPDGQSALATPMSDDKRLVIWDLKTGNERQVLAHNEQVTAAAFSPDGRQVLSSIGGDGAIRLWDLNDDHLLNQFRVDYTA